MDHKELISNIIDKRGNAAGVERALEIPQGTFSRMLTQDSVLPEELALLNIINMFPWMVDVADHKFCIGQEIAKKQELKDAVEYMKKKGGVSKWEDTNPRMSVMLHNAAACGLVMSIPESRKWVLL